MLRVNLLNKPKIELKGNWQTEIGITLEPLTLAVTLKSQLKALNATGANFALRAGSLISDLLIQNSKYCSSIPPSFVGNINSV